MIYHLRITTNAALCALVVYGLYAYLMVATYAPDCSSVVCQAVWG